MASESPSIIGQATFVRGRVSGSGDLEIAGRVEGDVVCSGEVVIEAGALVAGNVSASRIVVRGAVKGDLVADDTVRVESGGRAVGDLRAPRIGIAPGGLVRGHVETASGAPARTRSGAVAAASAPSRAETPKARAEAQRRPLPAAQPPPVAEAKSTSTSTSNHRPSPGATLAGARIGGPPPPVVPVLKKGTKAVQKKQR